MPVILALAACCAIPLVIGGVLALFGLRKKPSEADSSKLTGLEREELCCRLDVKDATRKEGRYDQITGEAQKR